METKPERKERLAKLGYAELASIQNFDIVLKQTGLEILLEEYTDYSPEEKDRIKDLINSPDLESINMAEEIIKQRDGKQRPDIILSSEERERKASIPEQE